MFHDQSLAIAWVSADFRDAIPEYPDTSEHPKAPPFVVFARVGETIFTGKSAISYASARVDLGCQIRRAQAQVAETSSSSSPSA
jgi:hypothetical protein